MKLSTSEPWRLLKRSFSQLSFSSKQNDDLTRMDFQGEDSIQEESVLEVSLDESEGAPLIPKKKATSLKVPTKSTFNPGNMLTYSEYSLGSDRSHSRMFKSTFATSSTMFKAYMGVASTSSLKHVLLSTGSKRHRTTAASDCFSTRESPISELDGNSLGASSRSKRSSLSSMPGRLIRLLSLSSKRHKKRNSGGLDISPELPPQSIPPRSLSSLNVPPRLKSRVVAPYIYRPDLNLRPRRDVSSDLYQRVMKIAKEMELDDSAVGSLLVILDEESALQV